MIDFVYFEKIGTSFDHVVKESSKSSGRESGSEKSYITELNSHFVVIICEISLESSEITLPKVLS